MARAQPPKPRISCGVTYRKNPERFIVAFKDAYLRIDIVDNKPEPATWRKPHESELRPMSTFGHWALCAKDQNFIDAILIAGVKKNDD